MAMDDLVLDFYRKGSCFFEIASSFLRHHCQKGKNMLKEEFEELTGIYPPLEFYKEIEKVYGEMPDTKEKFCRAYAHNEGGLAKKIQASAEWKADDTALKHRAEIAHLEAVIEHLRKEVEQCRQALDKELEWEPYHDDEAVRQEDYEKLSNPNSGTKPLSDEESVTIICGWFGFDREKVKIEHTAPVYEKNRHGKLRMTGTVDRMPLYNATDWNYIRFSCEDYCYEARNGGLHMTCL